MKLNLITTADGSHSIAVPQLDEHYHSVNGAMAESMHIFINNGLFYFPDQSKLNILEIGFGTGLNALLTCLNIEQRNIAYTALEPYPLPTRITDKLNYTDLLGEADLFKDILKAKWTIFSEIVPAFCLQKLQVSFQEFETSRLFDLIYFDAFGPHAQAELWELDIFVKAYNLLNAGGILITYCAKGSVKRNLKAAGFSVEGLPGPAGKREITRAVKQKM